VCATQAGRLLGLRVEITAGLPPLGAVTTYAMHMRILALHRMIRGVTKGAQSEAISLIGPKSLACKLSTAAALNTVIALLDQPLSISLALRNPE
jgi:hypothetical protein